MSVQYTSFEQLPLALKVEDVMKVLGASRNTVYDFIHCGKLRSIRVGRRILVPKDALQDFLKTAS